MKKGDGFLIAIFIVLIFMQGAYADSFPILNDNDVRRCNVSPSLQCWTGSVQVVGCSGAPGDTSGTCVGGFSQVCVMTPKPGRICGVPTTFITSDTTQAACESNGANRCYTGEWTITGYSPRQTAGCGAGGCAPEAIYECQGTAKMAGTSCSVAGTPGSPASGTLPHENWGAARLPFEPERLTPANEDYRLGVLYGALWGENQDRGQCGYDAVTNNDNGKCYRDSCDVDNDHDGFVSCVGGVQGAHASGQAQYIGRGSDAPEQNSGGDIVVPYPGSTGNPEAGNAHFSSGNYIADCDDSNANYQTDKKLSLNELTAGAPAFDPEYLNKTIVERHFDPRKTGKFTPFDDIVIPLSYTAHEYCPTRWNTEGLNVSIVAGDEVIVNDTYRAIVMHTGAGDDSAFTSAGQTNVYPVDQYYQTQSADYVLKLSSAIVDKERWGWQDARSTDRIIAAVAAGKTIKLRLQQTNTYTNTTEIKDIVLPMTNCYQTYGEGEHSIVFMNSRLVILNYIIAGDLPFFKNIYVAELVRKYAFFEVDPFRQYASHFSYFVDLQRVNDLKWEQDCTLVPTRRCYFKDKYLDIVPDISSCKNKEKYFFGNTITYAGYTIREKPTVFINPLGVSLRAYTHEYGHAFCNLNDEYSLKAQNLSVANIYHPGIIYGSLTNCAFSPVASYSSGGIMYGSAWKGCSYSQQPQISAKAPLVTYYRPSENSLMNTGNLFNVVSCGYCLSKIKGGSAKSNFPECNSMNVIRTPN